MVKIHLSKLMGERRISQAQLARKTGIRPNTIGEYYHELTDCIKLSHINKICKVLNCTASELIEYIPDEESNKKRK